MRSLLNHDCFSDLIPSPCSLPFDEGGGVNEGNLEEIA